MELWDQQPGESSKAYQAFRLYRDFGPMRSMNAVWDVERARKQQHAGSTPQTWKRWSSRFSWVERAQAFDHHKERLEQEAYDTQLHELLKRRMMREMRVQGDFESLADRLQARIEKLVEMPPTTVHRNTRPLGTSA